jgi:N-acetyl-anhydromuramyl-L-alanine amidase AmpD
MASIAGSAAAFCMCSPPARGQGTQDEVDAGAGYIVDRSVLSPNRDFRERTLILHYTAVDLPTALNRFTQPSYGVSTHYLVASGEASRRVFGIVPEEERAWHAGISQWKGVNNLNFSSIGIEIVNLGFPADDENLPPMQRRWYPYDDLQIDIVGQLARHIVDKYAIEPSQVVGHSDVAPGRKFDPGPLFPWQRLYQNYGVGAWPDAETVASFQREKPYDGDVASLQARLVRYGYGLNPSGVMDQATTDVLSAFQMHFRPARYDGTADLETVAILDALLAKYSSNA